MRISDWSSDVCSSDLGRKIVWTVLDNHFSFTSDATEWTGTDIVFEIEKLGDRTGLRFTHVGLVPGYECYDVCHDGWTTYVASLRDLVATGTDRKSTRLNSSH